MYSHVGFSDVPAAYRQANHPAASRLIEPSSPPAAPAELWGSGQDRCGVLLHRSGWLIEDILKGYLPFA
jgi:hypothetical protein